MSSLLARYRQPAPVTVTRPSMPPLAEYTKLLEGIWSRRWLTNNGDLHRELAANLSAYLGVEHLSLFCNGATALLVALQALRINGRGNHHTLYVSSNHPRPALESSSPSVL